MRWKISHPTQPLINHGSKSCVWDPSGVPGETRRALQKTIETAELNLLNCRRKEGARPFWSRLPYLDLITLPQASCFILTNLKPFLEGDLCNKMLSNGDWGCMAWKYHPHLEVHLAVTVRIWIWPFSVTFATVSQCNISKTLFTWTSALRTHTGRPHTVCQSVHDTHQHTNTHTIGAGNLAQ